MSAGLDNLKHIVVLMMENRSFDHMLGGLMAADPRINGLTGSEVNLDPENNTIKVQPLADYQGQLDPDPGHSFAAVQKQIFGSPGPATMPTMQGFVRSYFDQRKDTRHARTIMYYFRPEKLPVLTTLARNFAVFNGWFSSVPGPGLCNHTFAHYGTSFGSVGAQTKGPDHIYPSVLVRLLQSNRTAKLYSYDRPEGVREFATYEQFLADCRAGTLPDYSFIEPNHSDHLDESGKAVLANDQHPDHNVQAGELFIASVYNALLANRELWTSTALLIVYDEHGGLYDHVPPPACTPDAPFIAPPNETGTDAPFAFDRLGVRVPAILVSPWIAKGTVVPGPESPSGRIFEHASIPATVTQHFMGGFHPRSPRELGAQTFTDLLGDVLRPESDCPRFEVGEPQASGSNQPPGDNVVEATAQSGPRLQELAGYKSDEPEGQDLLEITGEVQALATVLAAKEVSPPLSLGLFGNWGSGKSFFMRQLENRIRVLQEDSQASQGESAFCENIVQITFNAWNYIDTNLWASLTTEIFEGLAAALAKKRGGDSQDQRALVLAAASSSQTVLEEAEKKKAEADEALRQTEQRLATLQKSDAEIEASLNPVELFNAARRFALTDPQVQGYVEDAAKALRIGEVKDAAENVNSEIMELRGIGNSIWFTIRHTEGLWIWIAAVLAALGLGWGATQILHRFPIGDLAERVVSTLTAVSGFLLPFLVTARKALAFLEKARAAKQQLIEAKKKAAVDELNKQRADLAQKVIDAQKSVDAAATRASELSGQLEKLRADRKMADYIRQRNESTDYTSHLGLIARVRSDFKQLSLLLRDVKEEADSDLKQRQVEKDKDQKLFPRIDRIVLYIDDLDRCPSKNVVEVLQAVNLLLAFPLFVVVVGVDPRWLVRSLDEHAGTWKGSEGELDPETETQWHSTALNYLEKIFQIPYTLRPMDSRGFGRLVDELSTPQEIGFMAQGVAAGASAGGQLAAGSGAVETSGAEASLPGSNQAPLGAAPIDRRPEHLHIEEWERTFMKTLHELIPSPRAGKRFINVYRLIRASVPDRERPAFVGDASGGEHRCAMLLLAILTGYPAQATEILRELIFEKRDETWWKFIGKLKKRDFSSQPAPLHEWADLIRKLDRLQTLIPDQPCDAFVKWAPRIARYSFQSGRILSMSV